MMHDLRRLRMLRELHARGTLAAVATALSYSPSAVSQQLAALQRDAGIPLVERAGRRLRLTDAAHVLIRHAETLLAGAERAETELLQAASADTIVGAVRIASFQTATVHLVAPALAALGARWPGLRVDVIEADPEHALKSLALQEVDLALTDEYDQTPAPRRRGLAFEEIHRERVQVVLPVGHPAARDGLPALAGEPWAAGFPGSSHALMTARVCNLYGGFDPDVRHRGTDLLILLALVAAGRGVALLPDLAVVSPGPDVVTRPVGDVARRILLATREASRGRPALEALRTALAAASARL